jgi:hypothetical protein
MQTGTGASIFASYDVRRTVPSQPGVGTNR